MSQVTITPSQLDTLKWVALVYYLRERNHDNGLIRDKTLPGSPSSIAAVGLALAAAPVVVENGDFERDQIARMVLTTLRFFRDSPQGPEPDATGYKGFYYHFLDMTTGRRAWNCELSTIDSGFLIAGMLIAAAYFDREEAREAEIRAIADALYRRVDWAWAADGGATPTHGWRPESGFIPYRWKGYDESLLLVILALGSPTYPLPPECYAAWTSTFEWKSIYESELLYSGPLFTHQLSHIFIDFRGIRDAFMRGRGIDYFENSRRATYIQQEYAIRNPLQFAMYGEHCWGITASDGPGWLTKTVHGTERRFFDYAARGAPFGPDDGTIAPWSVAASLPFAPEIVLPTLQYFRNLDVQMVDTYGFKGSFNPTWEVEGNCCGWVSPYYYGIDQGPMVLMIENYQTGLIWTLAKRCPFIVEGLRRAGFREGWL